MRRSFQWNENGEQEKEENSYCKRKKRPLRKRAIKAHK